MENWRRYRHPKIYRSETKVPKRRPLHLPSARILALIAFVIVTAGLVWAVTGSGFFAIKDINITGDTTEQISQSLTDLRGDNILFVREANLLKTLVAKDPAVASIQVTRGLPDHMQINVTRRHPALFWRSGETTWAVDETGIPFPSEGQPTEGVPMVVDHFAQAVTPGEQFLAKSFIRFISEANTQVPRHIKGAVSAIEITETTFHVHFVTEWGWRLILDTTRPLETQLANFDLLYASHRSDIQEYADLRLAGWAYVK